MVCIYCGSKTAITNSRHQRSTNSTWRRRKCLNKACKAIFTTNEIAIYEQNWTIKSQETISPFLRDKLYISVYKSCGHRRNSVKDATFLTNTIINKLNAVIKDGTIDISDLLRICFDTLSNFDQIAATYYRAYYF
jgi:transcriptional regulator NrdR family protein